MNITKIPRASYSYKKRKLKTKEAFFRKKTKFLRETSATILKNYSNKIFKKIDRILDWSNQFYQNFFGKNKRYSG